MINILDDKVFVNFIRDFLDAILLFEIKIKFIINITISYNIIILDEVGDLMSQLDSYRNTLFCIHSSATSNVI